MVTVYTTPTCAPCLVAKTRLKAAGITPNLVDLTTEPEVLQALKDRLDVPQVTTPLIEFRGELHTIAGLSAIIKTVQADG